MDERTRTVKVRVAAANPEAKLRAGMFASVRIFLPGQEEALAVPRAAVLSDEGRSFVFVHHHGDYWVRRPVEPGRKWLDWVEVKGGLDGRGDARGRRGLPAEVGRPALEDGRGLRGLGATMRIIEWLLKNRLLVLGITAALAVAGGVAWTRLPIDAFPDVTNTQVMILTKAPGLAAVDVEQRVSFPIEQEMRGLPRVLSVRSLSKAELSQVVVVFEDGAETYWTRQIVFERLAGAREHLPPGVEPELGPISTGLGEIFQYTLEGRGALPDGPADDPGLDPRAAAPADPRRERGEQLRRRGEAVPGPRPSGPAREVPAHGSRRLRGDRAVERERGRRRGRRGVGADVPARRGPPPRRAGHRADRARRVRRLARCTCATSPTS